jgi:hypothetical protein
MTERSLRSPSTRWKPHLDMYHDLVAVTFTSETDLTKALARFWDEEEELFGVPRDVIGGKTMVLPNDAVQCLQGIDFITAGVVSAGELTPRERDSLRHEQGHH